MTKSKTAGLLLTTGIFLVGILCGILLGGMLTPRYGRYHGPFDYPRHRSDAMLQHFTRDLALTPAQREEMKVILADQKKAMNELMREVRPKIDGQMDIFKDKTRAILNEPQKKKFDAIQARDEARREKFRQRHQREKEEGTQP